VNRKLLILDVDETLVHGALQPLDRFPDHVCDWCYLYKCPHVERFMDFCRQHFRVAVWPSASVDHIRVCLDQICPPDYPFEFVWGKERCTEVLDDPDDYGRGERFRWRKNLRKVKTRHGVDLGQVIMVDDSPEKLDRHYGNLVQIKPFSGDPNDRELLRLMPYLLELKQIENIRSVEKRGWAQRFPIDAGAPAQPNTAKGRETPRNSATRRET